MKPLTLFMLCALSGLCASAQERWQADVSIPSMTLAYASVTKQPPILTNPKLPNSTSSGTTTPTASSNVVCTITVHNENDDDAYGTTLVVCLPVEVSVLSMSSGGTTHTASTGTQYIAYLSFDLGHMTVGQNSTVSFTYTKSKYTNKVGAFAYSGSPDPNPTNNYKEASIY
ncbi:MAG: hypothetical protein Q8932_03440 [Bacteroidota bacterium]|nr:hypothetical protein [Bacteroidota bacterium]